MATGLQKAKQHQPEAEEVKGVTKAPLTDVLRIHGLVIYIHMKLAACQRLKLDLG